VAVTDLTWSQVETALGNAGAIAPDADGLLVINPALITGQAMTMNDFGVIEFLYKFLLACNVAQTAINSNQEVGQRLAAFPAFSAGAPINNYVQISQQVICRIPLNTNTVIGSTN
jgi:hypothetical protein